MGKESVLRVQEVKEDSHEVRIDNSGLVRSCNALVTLIPKPWVTLNPKPCVMAYPAVVFVLAPTVDRLRVSIKSVASGLGLGAWGLGFRVQG